MEHLTIFIYGLLTLTGIVAGIVDTIAGSGGIITVPVLLAVGLSPVYALGTNKLQESVGQIVATRHFMKTGGIQLQPIITVGVSTIMGASFGAILVQLIHEDLLQKIIPILLMAILIYSIFSKRLFTGQDTPRMALVPFALVFGLGIGFYNGFFGPGTGSLWTAAFLYFMAMSMTQATMYAKPANLSCNLIALIWFVMSRHVLYGAAIALMTGQVIGAHIGAKLVINKGSQLIKPFFIVVVTLLTADLLYKGFY